MSRDAIPPAIADYQAQHDATIAARDAFLAAPPAELTQRDPYGRRSREATYRRPGGFDPHRHIRYGSFSYEGEFDRHVRADGERIRGLEEAIRYLRARHDAWRAPDEEAA